MAKEKTSPLVVRLTLNDGRFISPDGIVTLDGLLYHAWFAKNAPNVLAGASEDSYNGYMGLPLMLANSESPDRRHWAASIGRYESIGETVEYVNKRPDYFNARFGRYYAAEKGIISDSIGQQRAYRIPMVVRTIKDGNITFYCMGHADGIDDLLGRMFAVGKKPSIGYGWYGSYTIEESSDDYSEWHPDYGLQRPTPVIAMPELTGYAKRIYGIRPPYWKPCNGRLCHVPKA